MIIHELLLFLAGLGFGVVSRLAFVLISGLEKAINLKVITIIIDIIMSAAGVIAFVFLLQVFCDGAFVLFVFFSALVGFLATSIIK